MADDSQFVLYHYTPSLIAAVIFAVLFFLTTALHLVQRLKSGVKYFNPFIVGGICKCSCCSGPEEETDRPWTLVQIIGYGGRAVSHFHPDSTTLYAMQTLLILLAPTLYAASIYMVLGRVITHVQAQHHSVIPVTWMTKIFVSGDILSFILQGVGAYNDSSCIESFKVAQTHDITQVAVSWPTGLRQMLKSGPI
jgi:drug/metabolite transporter (DMT)-like permease